MIRTDAMRAGSAMTWFHVRELSRNSFFRVLPLTAPLVFLALKELAARASGTTADPGTGIEGAVVGLWTLTTTATGIIGFQRFQGTLQFQALSPRRPGTVFGPVVLAAVLFGLLSMPVGVLVASCFGTRVTVYRPWLFGAAGLVVVLACAASAFAFAAVFVLTRQALVYEQLLLTPIWLLSGVIMPWVQLPIVLRPLSFLLPLSGGMAALRASWTSGSSGHVSLWLADATVMTGLWCAVAILALRVALKRASVDGTLPL